jgi:hypothetical protein
MNQNIQHISAPKVFLSLLNQMYEMEQKVTRAGDPSNVKRNIVRMKELLAEEPKLFYEDPMGQLYNETRADLEAKISGTGTENLYVVEVIKPIIRYDLGTSSVIIQKGIVIVESKK